MTATATLNDLATAANQAYSLSSATELVNGPVCGNEFVNGYDQSGLGAAGQHRPLSGSLENRNFSVCFVATRLMRHTSLVGQQRTVAHHAYLH